MQHHANLLIGSRDWGLSEISQKKSRATRLYEYEQVTIGHARELISQAHLKPVDAEDQIFVLTTKIILGEAQNTLLKLFEDPPEHTYFYLILPKEDLLLPTLRSRLHLVATESVTHDDSAFESFLAMNPAERISVVEKKLKEENAEWVEQLVSGFEVYAQNSKEAHMIKNALMITRYIGTKGASKKMLLEHLALSL